MVCLHPDLPHNMNTLDPSQPHFYFALPRLIATMRGADARRAALRQACRVVARNKGFLLRLAALA